MEALELIESWPVGNAAAGVVWAGGAVATRGSRDIAFPWASVTKPVTALAVLVAAEEGVIDLDEPAGPPGATVRHLLAHASGLPLDGAVPIAPPGRRRVYSNAGFEVLAATVERHAEMPFGDYLTGAVLEPLGLSAELVGSPASGLAGSLDDLLAVARDLLEPRLVSRETLEEATAVAFPGLVGVLPGYGRMSPNDWGLGFELRDSKSPHWTGTLNSQRTFGHFGQSGAFLWADPDAGLACGCLTDMQFGDWARQAWPRLSDAVLAEAVGSAAPLG